MNRQDKLDWLCRNVQPSQWYEHYPFALVALDAGHVYHAYYYAPVEDGFTRTEYLNRRAEFQNKPSWDDAPEGADFLVQNKIGSWQFGTSGGKDVNPGLAGWIIDSPLDEGVCFHSPISSMGEVLGDWRDTLERRPVQTPSREFNPATIRLTDSQARELAIETGTCSDGGQCGIGGFCDDCHLFDDETQHSQNAEPVHPDDMTPPFEGEIRGFSSIGTVVSSGGLIDPVNHPQHYTQGGIECIDALAAATVGKSGIEAVCVANAIKYLWRYESKGGVEDVKKARWYIDRLISELEKLT